MQGIFKGSPVYYHDNAWTVALDMTQDDFGICSAKLAHYLIERSGCAGIVK